MKRIFIISLLVLSLLIFAGCDKSEDKLEPTATPVVTSEPTETPVPTETPEPTATPVPATNLAQGKPVTADNTENESFGPENAVDGDETTRWSGYSLSLENSMQNYDRWLIVDLEKEYTINSFEILWEYLAVSFKLEVSLTGEDGSYTTVFDTEGSNSEGAAQQYAENITPVKARFVKVSTYLHEDQNAPANHPYCSIYELYVNGYDENELNKG